MKNVITSILFIFAIVSCGGRKHDNTKHPNSELKIYSFNDLKNEKNLSLDSFAVILDSSPLALPDSAYLYYDSTSIRDFDRVPSIQMSISKSGKDILRKFKSPEGYTLSMYTAGDTIFIEGKPLPTASKANAMCVIKIIKNTEYCYRGNCRTERDCKMYDEGNGSKNCVCEGTLPEPEEPSDPNPYPIPPVKSPDPIGGSEQ